LASAPRAIRFEINIVNIGAGIACKQSDRRWDGNPKKGDSHETEDNQETEQGVEERQKN
jgi:hypothetical protein